MYLVKDLLKLWIKAQKFPKFNLQMSCTITLTLSKIKVKIIQILQLNEQEIIGQHIFQMKVWKIKSFTEENSPSLT